MSVQKTLDFKIRKRSFYGKSQDDFKPTPEQLTGTLRSTPSSRYTPNVKKVVDISSSSEDSDSDSENVAKTINITRTPKRKPLRTKEENESSPPKQKRSPPKTPSTLLNRLKLSTPKKDRLSPKSLFANNKNNKYSEARKALHSSVPENITGRESELATLEEFINSHLKKKTSASMYISGPPGTGKTLCLSKIMLKPKYKEAFKIIYVNCTTMKSAPAIYKSIVEELNLKTANNGKNSKSVIENYLKKSRKMLLLVLDEIDQLETKNQAVLYSIFEWPAIPESQLVLIGIANALDLTDRILPRLQSKCELKPTLLHFKPYSKEQIADIITKRLNEANAQNVFTATAVQLLSAKVAAVSGDIRKALDICRRGVEIAESEKMSQDLTSASDSEATPVDFKQVLSILNGVYGGSQNVDTEESSFPTQQKIILCSLMLVLNKGRNKDINLGKLHQVYKNVCKKRNTSALDMSEFTTLCSLIETRGIIRLLHKKDARLSKVSLQWDQEMVTNALQDKVLTSEIVNDVSCL